MTASPTIEHLMTHQAWLRRLVVELVGETDADDVVQQTWMAALRSPPRDPRTARGWLARVARNFIRRRHRDAAAMERRERRASVPEALPAAEDIVAELSMQRHVSACVMRLEEPYRSALLWRYYEQLSVEEIATRSDSPASTIRTRLQRGLQTLRGTGGDFTAAVSACLADDTASTSLTVTEMPAVGDGSWYLIRGGNCGGQGSYDSGGAAQAGSRDAEINASVSSCP